MDVSLFVLSSKQGTALYSRQNAKLEMLFNVLILFCIITTFSKKPWLETLSQGSVNFEEPRSWALEPVLNIINLHLYQNLSKCKMNYWGNQKILKKDWTHITTAKKASAFMVGRTKGLSAHMLQGISQSPAWVRKKCSLMGIVFIYNTITCIIKHLSSWWINHWPLLRDSKPT